MGRDGRVKEIETFSREETMALGYQLGEQAAENTLFCFFGGLGAGKTTLIKGIAEAVTGVTALEVSSPTFVYLNIYPALKEGLKKRHTLYHFDLYRLKEPKDFFAMGFEEYFFASGVSCVEWSERLGPYLPSHYVAIHFTLVEKERRTIKIDEKARV